MLQFKRITTQGRFIPQIDGLRFVAIASVVLFHIYSSFATGPVRASWMFDSDLPKRGVELFFAISGFILGVPFASHFLLHAPPVPLKQYLLRRLTRLEPPYFISLLLFTVDQMWIAHRSLAEIAPHLLASALYLHNLVYGAFVHFINGVAWSLEIEVQFYLLAPILALLFAIRSALVRRGLMIALMVVSGLLGNRFYPTLQPHLSILYYIGFFLAGFLTCDLYLTRRDWKTAWYWDALTAAGWPLVWYLGRNAGHLLIPFVIVVLYVGAFRGRIFSAVLSNPVITGIGGMCYSIYLFHTLVIGVMRHITGPLHIGENFWLYFGLQTIFTVPVVLILCGAFFLLIERPCMDRLWPQKLWQSLQQRLRKRKIQPQIEQPPAR